jgi:hypothetical protein
MLPIDALLIEKLNVAASSFTDGFNDYRSSTTDESVGYCVRSIRTLRYKTKTLYIQLQDIVKPPDNLLSVT